MIYDNSISDGREEIAVNSFTKICCFLTDHINKRQHISADDINIFSKFVRVIFCNNIDFNTDEFKKLYYTIKIYWEYDMIDDENKQRSCSYIQLYQMVAMIHQYYEDKHLGEEVAADADDYIQDLDILNLIKRTPGITFGTLHKALSMAESDLLTRLDVLENKSFISSRSRGYDRYFILSRTGIVLVDFLRMKKG